MAVNNLNTPGVGIQPSLIDAKGDLLVGTANDAIDRLGVTGTTGAVLTADAGETTGLKWAAAGSVGGLVHIETQNPSAVAGVNFNNVFTSDYDNYEIWIKISTTASAMPFSRLRAGGVDETGSNYIRRAITMTATTPTGISGTGSTLELSATNAINAKHTTIVKAFDVALAATSHFIIRGNVSENQGYYDANYVHNLSTAYDGFSLQVVSGTITGIISVYGLKK